MKKQILFLLSMSPAFLLAQSESFAAGSIAGGLFTLTVMLVLFLILRGLMLWYWKVDKILKNQQETNDLLRSIDEKMGKQLEQHRKIASPVKDKEDDRWGFVNKGGLSK